MVANEIIPPNGAPIEDRVVKHVRDLEAWYSAEFERRLAELTEILNAQVQTQIQELRAHYEVEKRASAERPQPLLSSALTPEKILQEINRNETMAQKCSSELERMVATIPSVWVCCCR